MGTRCEANRISSTTFLQRLIKSSVNIRYFTSPCAILYYPLPCRAVCALL